MIDDTVRGMISVWMGISMKSYEDFNEYTEGMEYLGSGCPACRDFGTSFIDSDFFGAYRTANHEIVPMKKWRLILGRLLKRLLRRPKLKG